MKHDIDVELFLQSADKAGTWLKAIANPYRLLILSLLLKADEISVTELNEVVPLSQSALSQHLAILRKESIVKTRKSAQVVFYSLKNEEISQIIDILYKKYGK